METPWRGCYCGISAEITAAQKKAYSDHASRFREHELDGRGREVHEWQIAPGVVDRPLPRARSERPARCRPFAVRRAAPTEIPLAPTEIPLAPTSVRHGAASSPQPT